MWCGLLKIAEKQEQGNKELSRISGKIKMMLLYIYEHYPEKITVRQVAEAAFISERECFRVFRDCLQTTPVEYLMNYRKRAAKPSLLSGRPAGWAAAAISEGYSGKPWG